MNTGYASAHWFLSLIPACVKWRTYFSQSFKMLCGVRQGGVLSPYLFAVYIDIRRLQPRELDTFQRDMYYHLHVC